MMEIGMVRKKMARCITVKLASVSVDFYIFFACTTRTKLLLQRLKSVNTKKQHKTHQKHQTYSFTARWSPFSDKKIHFMHRVLCVHASTRFFFFSRSFFFKFHNSLWFVARCHITSRSFTQSTVQNRLRFIQNQYAYIDIDKIQ